MKFARCASLLAAGLLLLLARPVHAQAGAVEFTVRITPSSGLSEPVRGMPFYLLRKSYAAIAKEAETSIARPSFDAFVDGLKESKELKTWMKSHHSVKLNGDAFVNGLTADDIFGVPEFWSAYIERNAANTQYGFPAPKYKESDRTKKPAKFQREMNDYRAAVRKYLLVHPESTDGIDLSLEPYDASHTWNDKLAVRNRDVHRLEIDLAQSKYTVAQTQTGLDGTASFNGLAPGTYWLSTLGIEAEVGDTHEAWDTAVTVRANSVTQVTLSNFNGATLQKQSP